MSAAEILEIVEIFPVGQQHSHAMTIANHKAAGIFTDLTEITMEPSVNLCGNHEGRS